MSSRDIIQIHKHVQNKNSSQPICAICYSLMDSISPNIISLSNINEIESYPFELFDTLNKNQNFKRFPLESVVKNPKRKSIIDFLLKAKRKLNLSYKIIHLTIYLLDTIISINAEKYAKIAEKICIGCLILAIKFLEEQTEIAPLKNFEFLSSNTFYPLDELKKYEIFCIKKLKYNLSVVTPVDYLEYFESKGMLFINDISTMNNYINIKTFRSKMYEILIKSLYHVSYTDFPPIDFAVYALCQAREFFNLKEKINKYMSIAYKITNMNYINIYERIKQSSTSPGNNSKGNKSSRSERSSFLDTANSSYTNTSLLKCNSNKSLLCDNSSCSSTKGRNIFKSKEKEKKKRNVSVSMKINSMTSDSFLNEYIKTNLISFKYHNKDNKHVSNHSNDSKKNDTPDTHLNIPYVKKFKYQNIKDITANNLYYAIPQCAHNTNKKKKNLSLGRDISDILKNYKKKESRNIININHEMKQNTILNMRSLRRQKRSFSNSQNI